jgi:transcriptional regulator of acetoin/glycerol metabolism
MGNNCKETDLVRNDWQSFVKNGELNTNHVRNDILKSWIRCKNASLNPYDDGRHPSLDKVSFEESLSKKERLIRIAHPFMTNVYKFVKGTGFVVVLTNEEGYILEMFADDDVWSNPVTNNFFLGASWEETVAGTNAIGTALITKEAVQVSGSEHFCEKHHCLTCSAAPIFDVSGELIGIIDISGSVEASHLHTLGMVVSAAESIMAQLRIENKNVQLAMANRKLVNFFNMVSDGVLIVDSFGAIAEMNPAAETILTIRKRDGLGIQVQKLITPRYTTPETPTLFQKPCAYKECVIHTDKGQLEVIISVEPFYDQPEHFAGSFVTVRPVKQVQKLINRFSGYMASLQFKDIVGSSYEIREAIRLANLTAINNSNVLLTGESGTGKEIFAQAIHNKSSQCNAPFVPLNCGAIPRELIGSELFGYEDGAFTGAKRGGRLGKFELASGGTLFLDEIGDMPLEHQTVLLRVIQEKKIVRIGGDKMIPVDVRLICATNKNLMEEVEKGTFRRDLFYRLNVMSIMIPPLKDRIEDIPLLFRHFLNKLCDDREQNIRVDRSVYDCLKLYKWPGNVRELQNIVERAVNLAEDGVIYKHHLPEHIRSFENQPENPSIQFAENLAACRYVSRKEQQAQERESMLVLLNQYAGNVSRVAKEMGLSRKTVYNKMRDYAIYR